MRLRMRLTIFGGIILCVMLVGWIEVPRWYSGFINSHQHVVPVLKAIGGSFDESSFEKFFAFISCFAFVMFFGGLSGILAFYFVGERRMGEQCSSFVPDDPIHSFKADELGLDAYIMSLGSLILHAPKNGKAQCIGLYGHWGDGKTSARYLLEERLRTALDYDCVPIFVDVNVLSFASYQEFAYDFFRTIAEGVARGDEDLRSAFLSLADNLRVRSVSRLFATDNIWINILKFVSGLSKDLPQIKGRLKVILRRLRRRVIVVVDDLDRMQPKDVCAILRLLKGNGDLPNITYLILADETYLAASIADLMPPAMPKNPLTVGREYLEKIVPFECPLPELTNGSKLENYFRRLLTSIVKRYCIIDYDVNRDEFECVFPYFRNIRALKRLLNAYEKELALQQAKDGERKALSIHAGDVLALTALRLKDPDFYHFLHSVYNDLLAGEKRAGYFETTRREAVEKALLAINEGGPASIATKFLESRLKVKKSVIGPEASKTWYSLPRARSCDDYLNYRISSSCCFDNYFMAETPDAMIRRQSILDFVQSAAQGRLDWGGVIGDMEERGRIRRFLLLLTIPPRLTHVAEVCNYLSAIADLAERNWKSEVADECHQLVLSVFDACCSCYWDEKFLKSVFGGVLETVVSGGARWSVVANLITHKKVKWLSLQDQKMCLNVFFKRLKGQFGLHSYLKHGYRLELAQAWGRIIRDFGGEYLILSMKLLKRMRRMKNGERGVVDVFLLPREHNGEKVYAIDVSLMYQIFSEYEIGAICDVVNSVESPDKVERQIAQCLSFAISQYKMGRPFNADAQIDNLGSAK